jgi:hypothetical protein
MSQEFESQVTANIKGADIFAIQLNESTGITGKALLLAFSKFVCDGDITEQLYFANHSRK